MEIDKFIKIFDDSFKIKIVASLIKFAANKINFEEASIIGEKELETNVVKEIRNTKIFSFYQSKTLSEIHWSHYLRYIIKNFYIRYLEENNIKESGITKISSVDILKYEAGGFYKIHSDDHTKFPRILSVIIFLNNDYEGGELNFHDPVTKKIYKTIKPVPGRCVMWPSNFMYPHSVSPVTKGTRYSIVSWLN